MWRTSQCQADSHISHNKYTKQDRHSLYNAHQATLHSKSDDIYTVYCMYTFIARDSSFKKSDGSRLNDKKKSNRHIYQYYMRCHRLQRNTQLPQKTEVRGKMRQEKRQLLFSFNYTKLQGSFYILRDVFRLHAKWNQGKEKLPNSCWIIIKISFTPFWPSSS